MFHACFASSPNLCCTQSLCVFFVALSLSLCLCLSTIFEFTSNFVDVISPACHLFGWFSIFDITYTLSHAYTASKVSLCCLFQRTFFFPHAQQNVCMLRRIKHIHETESDNRKKIGDGNNNHSDVERKNTNEKKNT